VTFFAGTFLAPITVFFAGARLTVFFFAGTALAALLAGTFLGADATFFAGSLEALLAAVFGTALGLEAGLVDLEAGLVDLEAGLIDLGAGLEAGLFSLDDASTGLDLGANLTLPESPLGRWKTPFSAPVLIAFASWVL